MKRALLVVIAFVLVTPSMVRAQGPKKDIGKNVPLSPEASTDKDDKPPQKTNLPTADAISLDVDLVNVEATVTDTDGNPIHNLARNNFKVFDDNAEQNITNFSIDRSPITVAIMFEFGATIEFHRLLPIANGLLHTLTADDWAALVTFNRTPEVVVDFTRNKNELFEGLASLFVPRFPDVRLNDAVWDTLSKMESVDGRKAIFLIATGLDTGDFTNHTYLDTLKKTEASDTPIYALSVTHLGGVAFTHSGVTTALLQADNALRSFAENSGGQSFFPQWPQELPELYQKINDQAKTTYSLGFVPSNRTTDGKFHKLRVEVTTAEADKKGKPIKLRVQYKKGYYAPKS